MVTRSPNSRTNLFKAIFQFCIGIVHFRLHPAGFNLCFHKWNLGGSNGIELHEIWFSRDGRLATASKNIDKKLKWESNVLHWISELIGRVCKSPQSPWKIVFMNQYLRRSNLRDLTKRGIQCRIHTDQRLTTPLSFKYESLWWFWGCCWD